MTPIPILIFFLFAVQKNENNENDALIVQLQIEEFAFKKSPKLAN